MRGCDPVRKGYVRECNPVGKGYVRDCDPIGKGFCEKMRSCKERILQGKDKNGERVFSLF